MIKEAIGYANLEDFYEIRVSFFILFKLENCWKRKVWISKVRYTQKDIEGGSN